MTLGECEVKHGVRIGLANLYDSEVGNAQLPKKLQAVRKHRTHVRWAAVAIGLLVVVALAAALLSFLRKDTGALACHCRGKKHRGASV